MLCFDLTLKGYAAFYDKDDEREECFEQSAYDKAEGLIKWIFAPTKQAIDKFIAKHDLKECLDEIPCMVEGGHVAEHVALSINEDGDPVNPPKGWKESWMAEVAAIVEVLK